MNTAAIAAPPTDGVLPDTMTMNVRVSEKECGWCHTVKPAAAFYGNPGNTRDGLANHCIACHRARYIPSNTLNHATLNNLPGIAWDGRRSESWVPSFVTERAWPVITLGFVL